MVISFRSLLRTAAVATVAWMALAALPAQAYSRLYVFGDSLSDSGNNALATPLRTAAADIASNTFVPTFPYLSGTYSNGPVWAQQFASALGLAAAPSLAGGTNLAFGGAETGRAGTAPGGFPPSLNSQVSLALGALGNVIAADALVVYEGGGNNARRTLGLLAAASDAASFAAIVGAAAAEYAADVQLGVDALQAAGARNIVVWNTPNVGLTPALLSAGASASFVATTLSGAMNGALAATLASETGVSIFDVFGLLGAVAQNPAGYGLSNAAEACGTGAASCATALFYDGIHPTIAGHALLAGAMLNTVTAVPEPSTYGLMLLGLLVCAGVARCRAAR